MAFSFVRTLTYVFLFSGSYALFEVYGKPCLLLPWCGDVKVGLALYQYGFMLPLFTLVAILPVRKEILHSRAAKVYALGTFLVTVLSEDWFYFAFQAQLIQPGIYTTQWGYLELMGWMIIPYWYIFFIVVSIVSFWAGRSLS